MMLKGLRHAYAGGSRVGPPAVLHHREQCRKVPATAAQVQPELQHGAKKVSMVSLGCPKNVVDGKAGDGGRQTPRAPLSCAVVNGTHRNQGISALLQH
jgi:hypothetical protein